MIMIHTADLHLGASLASLPEEIKKKRLDDFFMNLEKIISFAIRNKADFFIIAGDVFQSIRPQSSVYNRFAQYLSLLLKEKIKVIIVAGNHDVPKVRGKESYLSALEKIALAYAKDLVFASEPKSVILTSRDKKKVGFILLPYLPPMEDRTEYVRTIYSYFKKILADLKEKDCDYIITVAHFLVEGARVREKIYESDIPIPLKCVWSSEVSYVALGHVHEFQQISHKVVYSGSIEKITFAEENDQKYFVIISEKGGDLEYDVVRLNTRPLITLPRRDLNIDSLDLSTEPYLDVTNILLNKLEAINIPQGAIVRIKYKIRSGQRLRHEVIYNLMRRKGALHTFFIPEIISKGKVKRPSPEALISFERAVREYIDTLNLQSDIKEEVLRKTLEYLKSFSW